MNSVDILGTLLFSLIFFIIFAVIIYIIVSKKIKSRHEEEKRLLEALEKYLIDNNCNTEKKLSFYYYEIRIDTINKKIAICHIQQRKVAILSFNQIIECKVIEDSNVIMEGGIGRAVVGGILFGGAGAIVGSTTRKSKSVVSNFSIQIITNDVKEPLYQLDLLGRTDLSTEDGMRIYKEATAFANDVYATVQSIISENKTAVEHNINQVSSSSVDELEKLANLKDKGIITEKEFEESKRRILSKL